MAISRKGDRLMQRHAPAVVALHAVVGALVLGLTATGLGLLGVLPTPLLYLLGGHEAALVWHRLLGLTLTPLLVALPVVAPRAGRRFVADATRFCRADLPWVVGFAAHLVRPGRHVVPRHEGRFDPVQRLVFALMLVALGALVVSGAALLVLPGTSITVIAACVQVHETAGWMLVGLVGMHVLAGSGVLPTHRRVGRAMVDGHVRAVVASRLWPAWAYRQSAPEPAGELPPTDHARSDGQSQAGAGDTGTTA